MLTHRDPKITPSNQNPPHKWLAHTIPLQIGEIVVDWGFGVIYGELFIVVGNIIWKIVIHNALHLDIKTISSLKSVLGFSK